MIFAKVVSSLEKVRLKDSFESLPELTKISALKGERISFQLVYKYEYTEGKVGLWDRDNAHSEFSYEGEITKYATFREVRNIGVAKPTLDRAFHDANYISKEPGLYPDVLEPIHGKGKRVTCAPHLLSSLWIDVEIPEDYAAGEYKIKLVLDAGEKKGKSENEITIEVIDAILPKQTLYYSQWFHCDCLANYYNVEVWSERHWEIVENFARVAHKNGINLLITPLFTLPLDTAPGGERLTHQLVGVTKQGEEYSFDFTLLDRWIDMCDRIGIKYFEISHFFTQWGAHHAPKVMATVDGEYKKIFGWETEATSDEYRTFLRTLIPEFLSHMKARGDDKRCFFHISDEPSEEHLESYKAAKAIVEDLLEGYVIMDAISNYDFYAQGICQSPVPTNNHITPFIENKVPNLWTYYCCSQVIGVSNRLVAMPSWRNRSIGYQMYKYDIVGFLQWGFNFYNNWWSLDPINPYIQQDGDCWVPAGDAFSVYPAQNGEALEAIGLVVFHEALQDISAMKLCEEYYGKEKVVEVIEEFIGKNVTFETCATSAAQILGMREKINEMIKAKLSN